mgnify:FL=1
MNSEFKIKNYIKLICLRVDHYESYIEDEVNTDNISGINDFIIKHRNEEGIKILMFEMSDMRMTSLEDARKYVRNIHAFDYIRGLIDSGHILVTANQNDQMSIDEIINHLIEIK